MTSLISFVEFLAADLYSFPLMFLVFYGEEFPIYLLFYDLAFTFHLTFSGFSQHRLLSFLWDCGSSA